MTLDDEGHDEVAIAERIDVPVDAIATLLEVGRVKLSALLAAPDDDAPDEAEAPPQSSGCAAGSARESTPRV